MTKLAILIAGTLIGFTTATLGAYWTSLATQDYRWGFLGMLPGTAVFVVTMLYAFDLGPFDRRRR
jgi:hypothetical protein